MVSVRLWTRADLGYVTESVFREGWGHIRRDVERCWRFEPNGCFLAEVDGKPVGHVFSICYGKVGWIGLLIVDPEHRGEGVGTLLTESAISFLRGRGVETIRLEAVEKAVPLYRRLGFREEFLSLRFRGQSKAWWRERRDLKCVGDVEIFDINEEDIGLIAGFDSKYFGVDRQRVLQSLYGDGSRGSCFVARRGRRILGYVMIREAGDAFWVGPWVCVDSAIAEMLLYSCVGAVGGGGGGIVLRVGVPVLNKAGVGLMERLGFSLTSRSVRMVLGGLKHRGVVSGVYGIGGPEKG